MNIMIFFRPKPTENLNKPVLEQEEFFRKLKNAVPANRGQHMGQSHAGQQPNIGQQNIGQAPRQDTKPPLKVNNALNQFMNSMNPR
jgi:hypothetical protein